MIKSMTGYGRGETTAGGNRYVAEVKTVNNRYKDVIVRGPKAIQGIEDEVRAWVSERIKRGRVEVSLQMIKEGEGIEYELELNMPLVQSYLRLFHRLNEECGLNEKVRSEDLCQMKDVIFYRAEEVDPDQARAAFRGVVGMALDSCDLMRVKEGEAIELDFSKRLDLVEGHLGETAKRAPLVVQEYRRKLHQRVEQLLQGAPPDEGRLAQEVAIFADRADITEELVRARSHLHQFREYMHQDDAVGRRLEFLLQELQREINTMSSKASDLVISSTSVEIKAELEKLREQVQNVE